MFWELCFPNIVRSSPFTADCRLLLIRFSLLKGDSRGTEGYTLGAHQVPQGYRSILEAHVTLAKFSRGTVDNFEL